MRSRARRPPNPDHASVAALLRELPEHPDEVVARLADLAARDTDSAHRLFDRAGHHGVSGVVDPLIASAPQLPSSLRDRATRRLAIETLWQDHVERGLVHAAGALQDAGVRACALKGPALGRRLYATPSLRHCMDVDLLVANADFDRGAAALAAAGYTQARGPSAAYMRRHSHHVGFARQGAPPVELHFRAYAGFGTHLDAGLLMDRCTPFEIRDSVSVGIPSPEDEFLYLAVHAAGHSFVRLVWLFDLKLLLRRHPALDWAAVADRAARCGVLSAVAFSIQLLRLWHGVEIDHLPAPLLHRSLGARLATRLLDDVSRPQQRSTLENFGGLLFTSLLCDRVFSAGWQLQHHMLRGARRRAVWLMPALLPAEWDG